MKILDRQILSRIQSSVPSRRLLQLHLNEFGLNNWGQRSRRGYAIDVPLPPMEPFFIDRRLCVARWPKDRKLAIETIFEEGNRKQWKEGYAGS